jgi:hypothetical protein
MATTIQVPGPTVVYIGDSILGYSDNDTLPSITFTDHMREIKTVQSGEAPEEIVLTNTTARISVSLVKWDETVLNTLLETQRGGGEAGKTVVGYRLIDNAAYSALYISSVGTTQEYGFEVAYLMNDGVQDSQWGNRERVLTLNFTAIPNPTTNVLYTYTGITPP